MNAHSDQISLRRYLDPLRRFARLVLVATLLGAGLGFAVHMTTGTTYTSYVSVLVSPISGDPVDGLGTSGVEVDMATEAEVATSLLVAERANDILAGEPPAKDPRDLLAQVETSVRGTRIIEIGFTAAEPESARRGAAAFADAFLSYRDELATSQLEVSSGRLVERIAQLQLELTDVSTRRSEVPESEREGAAYAALVINEQTLLDELSANQGRLADLRAVITDDAVVLDPASLPRSPTSLGLVTLAVGGAAAGFVLGAGLALMLDAARRRNEEEEQQEQHADAGAVHLVLDPETAPTAADAWQTPVDPETPPAAADAWQTPVDPETPPAAADAWQTPVDPETAPTAADAWQTPVDPADAWQTPVDPETAPFTVDETPLPDPFAVGETPLPDPFVVGDTGDEVWGRTASAAGSAWSSAELGGAGEERTGDDSWGAPLSGADEDAWAGIVETADDAAEEHAFSTSWDPPAGPADPWAAPSGHGEAASPAIDTVNDAAATEPIDLDFLLQERAREAVAQLGEHLTNAVDIERRAIVVVDGGDGAAAPVAVAMAVHLAADGRRTLLVDPGGGALDAWAPGRHQVRDHPALEVLVGEDASDHVSSVTRAAGEDTMVVFAGAAIGSPLVTAAGEWPGAIVIATTDVANPASIPDDAFEQVLSSRHPLIGIVSIMARPAMAPPSH